MRRRSAVILRFLTTDIVRDGFQFARDRVSGHHRRLLRLGSRIARLMTQWRSPSHSVAERFGYQYPYACANEERSRAMADEIIRILSIDGGRIRGIIPARLLQRIEESIGEPAATLFHLIAGTSTGGILGCGLARGKSAREIAELYADRGGEIFHRSLWDKVTTIDGLRNPA